MMTVKRIPAGIRRALGRLRNDRSGISLIYVTIALPAIIGFALLAIDVSRVWSLQSSLQHGADSLALAGAGELDRRPDVPNDSITRANRAINELVSNPALFADSVATIIDGSSVTWRFLEFLPGVDGKPGNDATPIPVGYVTTVPESARFVEVTVNPVNITSYFPASFLGGNNLMQASAVAVAGFDAGVCKFTPLFMCNPLEPAGNTDVNRSTELFEHLASRANRRRLMELSRSAQAGEGQQCGPGNFGLLQTANMSTLPEIKEALASSTPEACFIQNNIETKTGDPVQAPPIKGALNTRFDLYGPGFSSSSYPPSVNVRKGYIGPACNPDPADDPTVAMGLPRDGCFEVGSTSTCGGVNGRLGDGKWGEQTGATPPIPPQFEAYWTENFQSTPLPTGKDEDGNDITFSNSELPTRYEIYRHEITSGLTSNPSTNGGEMGTPQCNSPGTDDPDRRIIYGALVNCIAFTNQGTDACNGHSDLVSVAFAKFFMTEPVYRDTGTPAKDHLFVELVGVVEPGDATGNEVARDRVQLYR
jgi:hypothetical protein